MGNPGFSCIPSSRSNRAFEFSQIMGKKLRVHWLVTRSLQPFQLRYSLCRLAVVFNKLIAPSYILLNYVFVVYRFRKTDSRNNSLLTMRLTIESLISDMSCSLFSEVPAYIVVMMASNHQACHFSKCHKRL